ncbi:MAG: hypothetical protein QW057_05955 [Candidatus Bathyarchaeia archaeon]
MVFSRDESKTKRRGRRKSSVTGTPFQVQVFKKYLTSWKEMGRTVIAKPKRSLTFTHLVFGQKPFGFFDTKYETTAVYEVVKPEEMDERYGELYRRVKSMECVLARRGPLRRAMFFKPSPALTELQKVIPGLVVSEELARALNEDKELTELLRQLRPDEMSIVLHSVPIQYQPFFRQKEAVLQGMMEFYEKPSGITWIITIIDMLNRGPGIQTKADRTIAVLQRTAQVLKQKMDEIAAALPQVESRREKVAEEPSPTDEGSGT